MNKPVDGRRQNLALVLFLAFATAAGAGLHWSSSTDSAKTWRVVTSLSQAPIGEGRFFRASNSPFDPDRYQEALQDGGLQLLSNPDSPLSSRIRALIQAGTGNLSAAAETLRQLGQKYPGDAEILNDLGVIHMAMGKEKASNYFLAADLFERSRRLTIHSAAPTYNSAVVYLKLELDDLAAQRLEEYQRVEIDPDLDIDPIASLKTALYEQDIARASALLQENLPMFRQAAFDGVLNPQENSIPDEVTRFIFDHYRKAGTDPTIEIALAPLVGSSRDQIVESRKHIARGTAAYLKGKFDDAFHSYDLAEAASAKSGSLFDDLWLKLNRVDAWIRRGEIEKAREPLEVIIAESRKHRYKWLLGKALAAKGGDPRLSGNFEESLKTLNEAIDILISIDSPHDASRAMNYLATLYFFAGDYEESLDFAYRAVFAAPKPEHLRHSQPLVLAAIHVYRMGFPGYARILGEKALLEAKAAHNPGLVAHASSNLAILQSLERNLPAAEANFAIARTASAQIEGDQERTTTQLGINLLCARVMTDRGNLSEAESCLQQNRKLLSKVEGPVPYYLVQTLLQLSKTHQMQGRFDLAHENLKEAADALEANDARLSAGTLRLAFENERRIIYENAIAFEYDYGSKDTAWQHVQRYRSKLFLEFVGQFNPGIATLRGAVLDRSKVQQLIPPNVQVLEYVVLPDRLLIWLVSKNSFISTTVPVTRAELERRIADLLERTQDKSKAEFERQAEALHRILIEPIENRIGPTDTLAIIPDQALHRLNFPALYSQEKKSYLIERYPILESPSLASLLSEAGAKPSRDNAFAFGAQTDDTNATAELAALGKYYPQIQSFNGPKALKSDFLSSLERAGIFHFAGHSQDASDPLRSSVLLDGKAEGPNSITAADITKHRMPPNSVVVLASCDSSVGNSRDGVGMRGITSAFLISGAGSVVGSLWLVESDSTSRLVLEFHKSFAQDNLSVTESLRKAQLKFIADKVHPYYWSGFVVTGNASALR